MGGKNYYFCVAEECGRINFVLPALWGNCDEFFGLFLMNELPLGD